MAFLSQAWDMLALGYTKKHGVECITFKQEEDSTQSCHFSELHRKHRNLVDFVCYLVCIAFACVIDEHEAPLYPDNPLKRSL